MTTPVLHHFLLVFDHETGRMVELVDFGTRGDEAVDAYAKKEAEFRDRPSIDIVLVGSDSIETVRYTHANYFDGTAALPGRSRFLIGL